MGFVYRELERVTARLQAGPLRADEFGQLYAVQQALLWALEPIGFKAPYEVVTGIPAEPEDCRAGSGRSESSDIHDHHVS